MALPGRPLLDRVLLGALAELAQLAQLAGIGAVESGTAGDDPTTTVLAAVGVFAPTSYARARLLHLLHASGQLRAVTQTVTQTATHTGARPGGHRAGTAEPPGIAQPAC
jgi:hypothetical protein